MEHSLTVYRNSLFTLLVNLLLSLNQMLRKLNNVLWKLHCRTAEVFKINTTTSLFRSDIENIIDNSLSTYKVK